MSGQVGFSQRVWDESGNPIGWVGEMGDTVASLWSVVNMNNDRGTAAAVILKSDLSSFVWGWIFRRFEPSRSGQW